MTECVIVLLAPVVMETSSLGFLNCPSSLAFQCSEGPG